MVRPSRRKGIEEVYGTKLEAMQPGRPQVAPQPGMTKTATMRVASSRQGDTRTQRSYVTANDYYITTNVPLNATNMRNAPSIMMAQPSKTSQMPGSMQVQMQAASTQAMPYGSISTRRIKPTARQPVPSQQGKIHFVPPENKAHCQAHPHGHNHPHAKIMAMPMQMTQRNMYALNPEMDPNLTEPSDKDQMITPSNMNARRAHVNQPHPHPLQHQLHQQQQLSHPNSNNNMHHLHHHAQQQQLQQQHHLSQQQQHLSQQQQQHQKHQHPRQHQNQQRPSHSRSRPNQMPAVTEKEEKDEDPEEFFELIRQTVKTAVGTTIAEVVSRNFRDLSSKMERFSNELKMTNEHLNKLQGDVTNKVMHYGEENTRHFRYLCMKSEYDKMFYQHQSTVGGKASEKPAAKLPMAVQANMIGKVTKQAAAFNLKSVKQQMTADKLTHGHQKKLTKACVKAQNPCLCRSTSKSPKQQTEEQQSSSEQSVNVKSSELGVREVLGQIQRFCTQMQLNDLKDEQPKYNSQTGLSNLEMSDKPSSGSTTLANETSNKDGKAKTHLPAGAPTTGALDVELDTPVDSMDDIEIDNFQYSSDEMSSYSDDSDLKFTGSTTARVPLQSSRLRLSNSGAGDGQ